ncbi:MAG: transcriptional repressor [Candidatus Aminicenantes bacterium]|nr:transcriptional repressor [Candidatus Aminicenantes bacterium]
MQLNTEAEKLDNFRLECKKHDLKITPQRIAIYRELLKSGSHPTADEVYQALKGDFSNISYDTVNRTLLSLAEIGLIDVVKSPGGPRRFDPNTQTHHHLHCLKCGKIIDFFSEVCDELKIPGTIGDEFTVVSKRVIINGICKNCQSERKAR